MDFGAKFNPSPHRGLPPTVFGERRPPMMGIANDQDWRTPKNVLNRPYMHMSPALLDSPQQPFYPQSDELVNNYGTVQKLVVLPQSQNCAFNLSPDLKADKSYESKQSVTLPMFSEGGQERSNFSMKDTGMLQPQNKSVVKASVSLFANKPHDSNPMPYNVHVDFEGEGSALYDFIFKLLEETEEKNGGCGVAFQPSQPEGVHCEEESLGALAIKLAEVALMDGSENTNSQPVEPRNCQPESNIDRSCMQSAQPVFESLCPETDQKVKPGQREQVFSSMVKPGGPQKVFTFDHREPFNAHPDMKRKNFAPKFLSAKLQSKSNNSKKIVVEPKKCHGPPFKRGGAIPFVPSPNPYNKMKSSTFSSKIAAPPIWVQLPTNRVASDSSTSSTSSAAMEYNGPSPAFSNSVAQGSDQTDTVANALQASRMPRRALKAGSVSSSSSGGGGSRGRYTECVFCKTNGETPAVYRSHVLKDEKGRTVCDVLQKYTCPLCKETGSKAHTLKYCPLNKNPPIVATMTTLKAMRSSTGRKRHVHCSGQVHQAPFGYQRNLLPA